jgi:hypothetical protein
MSRIHTLRPGSPARQATGLRRWREGKVRPIPGNSPHDRLVGRGIPCSLKESLRRSLPRHRIPHQSTNILGAQYAFSKAWRNLSGPMGLNFKNQSQNQILARDHTASRWSAPCPGKRTRREEHALSHRPQMSSDRLFLDRVGRHQSPSPLRRHAQATTRFPRGYPKPELSTLPGRGTFHFALTPVRPIATAKLFSDRLGAFECRQGRKRRGFSGEEAWKADASRIVYIPPNALHGNICRQANSAPHSPASLDPASGANSSSPPRHRGVNPAQATVPGA